MSDLHKTADNAVTTLDGAINYLVTTLDVADASVLPATGDFPIVVWDADDHAAPTSTDEQMLVTGVSGDTLTVTRGIQNTTPVGHSDGETVSEKVCKELFDQIETVMGERVEVAGDSMTGALNMDTDAAGVTFGDGQDASIKYDGSNLLIKSDDVGSGETRIGAAANYLAIETDGTLRLVGTARVTKEISLPAENVHAGVGTAGISMYAPLASTVDFATNADEHCHLRFVVPSDIVTGSDIAVELLWAHVTGGQTGNVCWNITYNFVVPGEDITAAGTTITKTTAGTHPANILQSEAFAGVLSGSVGGDKCLIKLWRDVSEDDLGEDARFLALHLRYTADKLGGDT